MQEAVQKITNRLSEMFDCPVIHAPDTYEETLNSKASSMWGRTGPLKVDGFSVVWHMMSAQKDCGFGYLFFDFKEAE